MNYFLLAMSIAFGILWAGLMLVIVSCILAILTEIDWRYYRNKWFKMKSRDGA